MRYKDILEFVDYKSMKHLEDFVNVLWSRLGVDVEFSRHFINRVNDQRNHPNITIKELIRLFTKEYEQNGNTISHLDGSEAVMKDAFTALNLPFVIIDKQNDEKKMIAKTVMRKDNFKTPNPVYTVESENTDKNKKSPEWIMNYIISKHGHINDIEETQKWVESFEYYELCEVNLSDLSLNASWVKVEKFKKYADIPTEFPPIILDGNNFWIIDGYHRANASALRGDKTIKAYIGMEPIDELDEAKKSKSKKNGQALVNSGAIGHNSEGKYNKYNLPNTENKGVSANKGFVGGC